MSKNFTNQEMAAAKEMGKYENKWVAVSTTNGREKIVGSGERITDAKAELDRQGINTKNVTFRKIPSSKKILIA